MSALERKIKVIVQDFAQGEMSITQLEFRLLELIKPEYSKKVTKKMIEAEQLYDKQLELTGRPPSIVKIAEGLGIAETSAFHRLRRYREIGRLKNNSISLNQ